MTTVFSGFSLNLFIHQGALSHTSRYATMRLMNYSALTTVCVFCHKIIVNIVGAPYTLENMVTSVGQKWLRVDLWATVGAKM